MLVTQVPRGREELHGKPPGPQVGKDGNMHVREEEMLPSVQAFVIEQKFCVPTVYRLKTQAVMETSTGLPLVDSHSRNTDSCT